MTIRLTTKRIALYLRRLARRAVCLVWPHTFVMLGARRVGPPPGVTLITWWCSRCYFQYVEAVDDNKHPLTPRK